MTSPYVVCQNRLPAGIAADPDFCCYGDDHVHTPDNPRTVAVSDSAGRCSLHGSAMCTHPMVDPSRFSRRIKAPSLDAAEAMLAPGEIIVHTVGSRVTGEVVCVVDRVDRFCDVCGTDLVGNDPHETECPNNPACEACGVEDGHSDGCPLAAHDDPAYLAYCEASEREHEMLSSIPALRGHRAAALDDECEACGAVKPVLYERVAWTYGRAGVEGSEQTAFHLCAECVR